MWVRIITMITNTLIMIMILIGTIACAVIRMAISLQHFCALESLERPIAGVRGLRSKITNCNSDIGLRYLLPLLLQVVSLQLGHIHTPLFSALRS